MAEKVKSALKLNYGKTILMGFGFLAVTIATTIYDPYMTKILNRLLSNSQTVTQWSNSLIARFPSLVSFSQASGDKVVTAAGKFTLVPLFIGIIMTFDNIFGVIFQPTFGNLSDRTHTRLGKRRPYVIIGAPISALFFTLIPLMTTVKSTMICVIMFVFILSLWRAPVVALMPDLTPSELRSEGNAVINLMGGLGGLLGLTCGTVVTAIYAYSKGIPTSSVDEYKTFPYVFLTGAVIMIIGALVILFFVKEPDSRLKIVGEQNQALDAEARRKAIKEAKQAEKAERKKQKLTKGEKISLMFMLFCLFFIFAGSNTLQTYFSLFADEILHKTTAQATILTGVLAVSAAIMAIPAGKLGKKFGRKKTILSGLMIFILAFAVFLSIFTIKLSSQHLTINDYVKVNQVYDSLSSEIATENDTLATAAKNNNTKSVITLTVDDYVEYKNAEETNTAVSFSTEKKQALDELEARLIKEDFNFNNFVILANSTLGDKSITKNNISQAIAKVSAVTQSVTSMLMILIYPILILGGAANMMITVNTLPLVLEIGGSSKVGTFTGYYYTATYSAQIVAPIAFGIYRMFSGTYLSLFVFCPIAIVLALLSVIFVKHGEAIPDELIKAD